MNLSLSEEALKLHRKSIIIDGHCDTLGRVLEGQRRLGEQSEIGQFDLPRAKEGGLTAQLLATFFNDDRAGSGSRQSLQFIDAFHEEIEAYPELAMQATTPADILKAKELGKVALILSMEGAEGLEGDLRVLRNCYRLGLRCLGLTWNRRNEAADGMGERHTGGGLTGFGKKLVEECARLGIIIDIAHLSPAGVEDVFEIYNGPVIATHANCQALCPHPRNLTDAQLETIARMDGVVGAVPAPPFLEGDDNNEHSTLSVLLDHIDHMVKIMGIEGVGFGGDFDGLGDMRVQGIEDVSKLPNLTQGLMDRGYRAEDIEMILGGNYLRVFSAIL